MLRVTSTMTSFFNPHPTIDIDFRERGGEGERETDIDVREKHQLSLILAPIGDRTLNLGMCPEIKPTTFWCTGQCSNHLNQLAKAMLTS